MITVNSFRGRDCASGAALESLRCVPGQTRVRAQGKRNRGIQSRIAGSAGKHYVSSGGKGGLYGFRAHHADDVTRLDDLF